MLDVCSDPQLNTSDHQIQHETEHYCGSSVTISANTYKRCRKPAPEDHGTFIYYVVFLLVGRWDILPLYNLWDSVWANPHLPNA